MIQVKQLRFAYDHTAEPVLKGLDFAIEPGEVFGFLGPSGAGKSTTQKILYKLLSGFSGEVRFRGKPLQQWGREFYEQIGVSFELPNHYVRLTGSENLRFFSSFYRNPIPDFRPLLGKVDLRNDADRLVSEYSKGMKVRLNFVRSLLHNPEMMFFDEPTSGLDPINAGRIKQMIKDLRAEGKTIFITTHNMFDADQLCDRVALLHQGEIKALDTPSRLKLQYGTRSVSITTTGMEQPRVFPLEGLGNNAEFLKLIASQEVATIHSQEATLEEVFIKITGHQLA